MESPNRLQCTTYKFFLNMKSIKFTYIKRMPGWLDGETKMYQSDLEWVTIHSGDSIKSNNLILVENNTWKMFKGNFLIGSKA